MNLQPNKNPLLFDHLEEAHAKPEELTSPTVFVRRGSGKKRSARRAIRDARRLETATEAIADFGPDVQIHGLTKGQFSLIDLIAAVLEHIGPATLDISTWTAAATDVTIVCQWLKAQHITKSRWLVDLTFQTRPPELATLIRELFGRESGSLVRGCGSGK